MALVQARLRQRDELTDVLAPGKVVQSWPKGLEEWSTKAFRDAVYASPVFPRVMRADALKDTVARGVQDSLFGYAIKRENEYVRIKFDEQLDSADIAFSDEEVLVPQALAGQLKEAAPTPEEPVPAAGVTLPTAVTTDDDGGTEVVPLFTGEKIAKIWWQGTVPPQKWTTFYTKVLSRLVSDGGLELNVEFKAQPPGGLHVERADEVRQQLRELGIDDRIEVDEGDG
jgi:hypothetical protein